jgi:acyl-CoA thioester hydrolase
LLAEDGVIFAVRRVEVDYHAPGRFNDALQVGVKLVQHKRASMTFLQEIKRVDDEQILCSGKVQIACIDANRFRPCALPQRLVREIEDAI